MRFRIRTGRAAGGKRKGARGRRLPKIARFEEWDALIDAAAETDQPLLGVRNQAFIAVGLYSCLRVAELCDLDIPDVDLVTRKIHVRHGKGDKERYVYLHPVGLEWLLTYLEVRPGDPKVGPLWISRKKGARLSSRAARDVVKLAAIRAGIGLVERSDGSITSWFSPHKLRSSGASRMLETGSQLLEVANHLGHEDLNTTSRYVAISDSRQRDAVDRM